MNAASQPGPRPRLIVTRPLAQATPWVQQLHQLGCDAVALPLIQIHALADVQPLQQRWLGLAGPQPPALIVFVSANAVQHFFAARPAPMQAQGWPAGTWAGSTGPGTSAALLQAGVPAQRIVAPAADALLLDSEALWAELQRRQRDWRNLGVWVVRGGAGPSGEGRDWLADTLRQAGAVLDFVSAYRRRAPLLDAAGHALLAAALQQPQQHVWLFSSSEAVGHLLELVAEPGVAAAESTDAAKAAKASEAALCWQCSQAWAPHPRIAQAARQAGFGQVLPVGSTAQAVAQQWLSA